MIEQDSSDPTGVTQHEDQTDGKEVIRARDRKANAALQLAISGATWEDIAEALGFPTARAALVATEKALEKELRAHSKEFLRTIASKRLERLLRSTWRKAIDEDSPEHLPAVGKARELLADFRKLHGLDAPVEVAFYSPAEGEIEQWVASQIIKDAPALEEADIFDDDIVEGEVVEGEAV